MQFRPLKALSTLFRKSRSTCESATEGDPWPHRPVAQAAGRGNITGNAMTFGKRVSEIEGKASWQAEIPARIWLPCALVFVLCAFLVGYRMHRPAVVNSDPVPAAAVPAVAAAPAKSASEVSAAQKKAHDEAVAREMKPRCDAAFQDIYERRQKGLSTCFAAFANVLEEKAKFDCVQTVTRARDTEEAQLRVAGCRQ